MRIKRILSQHRRDFTAIYECEHCGATREGYGYDDTYFHAQVIPSRQCDACGEKAGSDYEPRATRYPDGQVV